MHSNELGIGVALLKEYVPATGTLKERLLAAMRAARKDDVLWFLYDNTGDDAFRCAVGAVMVGASAEEREQITAELRALRAISAATQGVPVDMAAVLDGMKPESALGLMGLWQEAGAPAGTPEAK